MIIQKYKIPNTFQRKVPLKDQYLKDNVKT